MESEVPGSSRKHKNLFFIQTSGLLRKNFNYQRKQISDNIFNFIIPAVLLVIMRGLDQALTSSTVVPTMSEQMPNGGFSPTPVPLDLCENNFFARLTGQCFQTPFTPNPLVFPFVDNTGAAGNVEYQSCFGNVQPGPAFVQQCSDLAENTSTVVKSGLLGGYSMYPIEYPLFSSRQLAPEDNSSVPLHIIAEYDENDLLVGLLYGGENNTPPLTDYYYGTTTEQLDNVEALDNELFDSWRRKENVFPPYPGAFVFDELLGLDSADTDPVSVKAAVYYNSSISNNCKEGRCQIGSGVHRLINAIMQQISPGNTAFPFLRDFPAIERTNSVDFIQLVITVVIGILLHFLIPPFLRLLTYERNSKIRVMMEMMGLRRSVYWLGTYVSLLCVFVIATIVVMIVGVALRLSFFRLNTPLSYLLLFFLWGNTLIAFVMFLVPFFQSPETALIFGWFYVVVVNFVGGPYLGQLYSSDAPQSLFNAVSVLPSFAFLRSIFYMGAVNSGGQGVTIGEATYGFDRLDMCGPEGPLCISYGYLIGQWAVLLALGLYLDRVLPSQAGVREHPLFFLGFKRGPKIVESKDEVPKGSEPDDVAAEREAASADDNLGIAINGLRKVFPGKVAVDSLSLAIPKGEVFGLLGHNGAGKTTTISMLTGLLDTSAGSAVLDGFDISTSMREIYRRSGVCPQFDVVWGDLTGEEHLYFYSRVKGFVKAAQKDEVGKALAAVGLTEAGKKRVKAYSGGMRRRLSVAISLMGGPSIVFLDEPTTGLDPKSKHSLWDCLQREKAGKTMVLTTHSMEEAERLCDRVGIMAEGRLKCVGPPEEVKLRLGRGYRLKVSLPEANVGDLHNVVTQMCPDASVEASLAGSVVYQIPRSTVLSTIFDMIESNISSLAIRDWGISQSTLEDIFIELTKSEHNNAEVGMEQEEP